MTAVPTKPHGSPVLLEPQADGSADIIGFLEAVANTRAKHGRSGVPDSLRLHSNTRGLHVLPDNDETYSKDTLESSQQYQKRAIGDNLPGVNVPLFFATSGRSMTRQEMYGKSSVATQSIAFITEFDTATVGFAVPSKQCTPRQGCPGPEANNYQVRIFRMTLWVLPWLIVVL